MRGHKIGPSKIEWTDLSRIGLNKIASNGKPLMISLVSPEYSLETFCYRMLGREPLSVMEAASAEITYARLLHRESTKNSNFRKGSRGWEYCEDLQRLVYLLMNGTLPSNTTLEFLAAVKPLVQQLLQK
jgi:hypothetical protein